MVTYIIRRLAGALAMLAVVSMVTFSIFFVIPRLAGVTADEFANRYVGRSATAETVSGVAEKLGLNDPVVVQYGNWVKGIFVGADYDYGTGTEFCPAPCFGYSFVTKQPVWPDLMSRLPITLSLAGGAAVIWLFMGVAIGILSALRRGSVFDRGAMIIALAGVSLPPFFTGLVALYFFSYQLRLTAPGGSYVPFEVNPLQWAYSLILPWLTLAFLNAAAYARLTRAGMLETLGEDYIRTARAKGLREPKVIAKHALRAALTPIVTIFGLDVGILLGGAILTENVFSLQGLGKFATMAIASQDLPKIMGFTMLAAFFIVIANLVVDLLYAVVDPRVRLS